MLRKVNVLLKKCDLLRARIKDGIALETRRDNSIKRWYYCVLCVVKYKVSPVPTALGLVQF